MKNLRHELRVVRSTRSDCRSRRAGMWRKFGDMMAVPILRKFSLCKNHPTRDAAASSMDAESRREK